MAAGLVAVGGCLMASWLMTGEEYTGPVPAEAAPAYSRRLPVIWGSVNEMPQCCQLAGRVDAIHVRRCAVSRLEGPKELLDAEQGRQSASAVHARCPAQGSRVSDWQ
jgi:hypothetical protein